MEERERLAELIDTALELLAINQERIKATMEYIQERAAITEETFMLMEDELRQLRQQVLPRMPLKRTCSVHDLREHMKKK